jgi:hypothetical protein
MMDLPGDREQLFKLQVAQIEEEKRMPYVTSIERLARQEGQVEGRAEGRAEMLLRALELRYQVSVSPELALRIRGTKDVTKLEQWLALVLTAAALEEFQQRMQSASENH